MMDGKRYKVGILEIKRKFTVLDGEGSGRVQSGTLHREIIGTFYNYTIKFGSNRVDPDDYDELYYDLSAPVESHNVFLPFGKSSRYNQKMYVAAGEDKVYRAVRDTRDGHYEFLWNGFSCDFVSMSPLRR